MKISILMLLVCSTVSLAQAQDVHLRRQVQVGFLTDYLKWTPKSGEDAAIPERILDGFNPPRNQAEFDRLDISHGKKFFGGRVILDNGNGTYTVVTHYTPSVGGSGGPAFVTVGASVGQSYYLIRQADSIDEARQMSAYDQMLTNKEHSRFKSWVASNAQLPKNFVHQAPINTSKLHRPSAESDQITGAALDPHMDIETFKNSDVYDDFKMRDDDPMNPNQVQESLNKGDIICSISDRAYGVGGGATIMHVGGGLSRFWGHFSATCALKESDNTIKVKTQVASFGGQDINEGVSLYPISMATTHIPWPLSDFLIYQPYSRHSIKSATRVAEEFHTFDLNDVCGLGSYASALRFDMSTADACAKLGRGVDSAGASPYFRKTVADRSGSGPAQDVNALVWSRKTTGTTGCARISDGHDLQANAFSYEDCQQSKVKAGQTSIIGFHRHLNKATYTSNLRSSQDDPEQSLILHTSAQFYDTKTSPQSLSKMLAFVEKATGHKFSEVDIDRVKGLSLVSLNVNFSHDALEKVITAKPDELWSALARALDLSKYDTEQWKTPALRTLWLDRVTRTHDESSKKLYGVAQDIIGRLSVIDQASDHQERVKSFLAVAKKYQDKPVFIRALLEISQGALIDGQVQFSQGGASEPIGYAIRTGEQSPEIMRQNVTSARLSQ